MFCCWEEDGVPVERFLEIIPLKRADAETIYSTIIECLKKKNLQVGRIVGMGFDGASAFSGQRTDVQTRIKKHTPHALFEHCHCHLLSCLCAGCQQNSWYCSCLHYFDYTLEAFHNSPKRAECLKEVQSVLELPEMEVIDPSDTHWLAHERCVKAVKASYSAIVLTIGQIYETTQQLMNR